VCSRGLRRRAVRRRPARNIGGHPFVEPGVETISLAGLRRYVAAHQAYATRFRRARAADVEEAVRRLRCVQLDSISTVDRAHRLTLTSRVGAYPRATVSRLLRERHWWGRKHDHDPKVKRRVLEALREHGPLPTRFFEGGGGGGMWNWKPEKRILEDLFAAGEVVVAGREGFQRLYALPEQVIPREFLDAPVPSEEEF